MNNYELRVNRIHSMIRACLDEEGDDEEFFSASDGETCPSPRSPERASPLDKSGNNSSTHEEPRTSAGVTAIASANGLIAAGDTTSAGNGRQNPVVDCRPPPSIHVGSAAPGAEMHDAMTSEQMSRRVSETIATNAGPSAVCATTTSKSSNDEAAVPKGEGVETSYETEPGSSDQVRRSRPGNTADENMTRKDGSEGREATTSLKN